MKVYVFSNIPGNVEISGSYTLEEGTTVIQFIQTLGLIWNRDALVVVNEKMVSKDDLLVDQDQVYLLIPILGG
ncbi:MAG TPA: MoaD/ThiS family protein [Bacillota bacterium]|nr:MoaD/ThiS family protein [Bacillota bacterium]